MPGPVGRDIQLFRELQLTGCSMPTGRNGTAVSAVGMGGNGAQQWCSMLRVFGMVEPE